MTHVYKARLNGKVHSSLNTQLLLLYLEQSFENGLFADLSKHCEAAVEEVHQWLKYCIGLLLNDVTLGWLRQ